MKGIRLFSRVTTDNTADQEEQTMKKVTELKQKAVAVGAGAAMLLYTNPLIALASGTAEITKPLDNLKTLVIAIIGAVGVIILAKNVMECAQAYQQQDSSTMNSALKGIVAGVLMAGISTVLTFLGF